MGQASLWTSEGRSSHSTYMPVPEAVIVNERISGSASTDAVRGVVDEAASWISWRVLREGVCPDEDEADARGSMAKRPSIGESEPVKGQRRCGERVGSE